MCVLEIAKYCFPFLCILLSSICSSLLCSALFWLVYMQWMHLRATWYIHCKCFCVVVLFTSCKRAGRGGGHRQGGAQWLPGEEEVEYNEVTPWQPSDSSHSTAPSPIFPLGPLWVCPPTQPPLHPLTERALRGAESRKTHSGSSYSAAAKGRQTRHTRQKQKTNWRKCL